MADNESENAKRFALAGTGTTISQCVFCKHCAVNKVACSAFPQGIPNSIIQNLHDHREPFPGDGAMRFEKRPDIAQKLISQLIPFD